MEWRLLKIIMNPAMIVTLVCGIIIAINDKYYLYGWFHVKMLCITAMIAIHGFLARYRKLFANGQNHHSSLFYRILNETITVIMITTIILVSVKPF